MQTNEKWDVTRGVCKDSRGYEESHEGVKKFDKDSVGKIVTIAQLFFY